MRPQLGSCPGRLGWEACGFPRKLEPGLRRPRPSPTGLGKTSDFRGALSRIGGYQQHPGPAGPGFGALTPCPSYPSCTGRVRIRLARSGKPPSTREGTRKGGLAQQPLATSQHRQGRESPGFPGPDRAYLGEGSPVSPRAGQVRRRGISQRSHGLWHP